MKSGKTLFYEKQQQLDRQFAEPTDDRTRSGSAKRWQARSWLNVLPNF